MTNVEPSHAPVAEYALSVRLEISRDACLTGVESDDFPTSWKNITGQYAGTPVFMPPEQIINFEYVKPVSDIWSFAAYLYQLLTRKFPYRFDPKRDPIDIILNENPVPIRDRMPTLEKNLAVIIDKALVRYPKGRSPDAGKLLAALR